MPEEFDPAWEYWEPNQEILEAMRCERLGTFDDLGLEGEYGDSMYTYRKGGTNFGIRMGRGNPDREIIDSEPSPPVISPVREKKKQLRRSCVHCGRGFDWDRWGRKIYCTTCCPWSGKRLIGRATCVQCLKEFYPRQRKYFRFCSPKCGGTYYAKPKKVRERKEPAKTGRPRTLFDIRCTCGNLFRPKESGQKGCSYACRPAPIRKIDDTKALTLFQSGHTLREIAKEFGVTEAACRKAIKRVLIAVSAASVAIDISVFPNSS